jgi:hypothetical protein
MQGFVYFECCPKLIEPFYLMSSLSMYYCKLSDVKIKGLNLVLNKFWGFSQETIISKSFNLYIGQADIDIDL